MFLIAIVVVGIAGFVVAPRVGLVLAGATTPTRATWLPWLSVTLFASAWLLPSPTVSGSDTFTQHAVSGAACATLGLFLTLNLRVRSTIVRVLLAYVVAASLGVAVELGEFLADRVQHSHLTADGAVDLVANTSGAIVAALALELMLRPNRRWRRSVPG